MKKQFILLFIILLILVRCTGEESSPDELTIVQGELRKDTVWEGEVLVVDNIFVPEGITLTILPGTHVRFQHYRGYKEPWKRLGLEVLGTILAVGTPDAPIYFTTDAHDPQNGDWCMIRVHDSQDSIFKFCVVEFAQQGINFWGGLPHISHCVIRWNNWEGLYFESYSNALIEYTRIYENGYNGIAAEQFNTLVIDHCLVMHSGTHGIHIDASTAEVTSSIVQHNNGGGLSVDNNSELIVHGVVVEDNGGGVTLGDGENSVMLGNALISHNHECDICGEVHQVEDQTPIPEMIEFAFEPDMSYALGYIPGDIEEDKFLYIYPDEDETRRVVKRIGNELGLTWAITWDGEAVWTATLWSAFYKLDPNTGEVLQHFKGPGSQPWGMAFDGENLWVVDFAEKTIFEVDPENGKVLSSFPSPDPVGGCKGLTWDGEYLYVLGWATHVIYQMDREGNLIRTISLEADGGGGLAWDGEYFWMPGGLGIIKVDREGRQVGWIYAASEGTWDLAWGNGLLWATQRTNENWFDDKVFGIEIINDHSQ